MDRVIYVHPGFPKTGTSLIQRNFFSTHPMINNLGKKESLADVDKELLNVFNQIILDKQIDNEKFQKNLRIIESIKYIPEKVNLISFEGFTQTNYEIGEREIFTRLYDLFLKCNFKLKILVTVRSQLTIIPSHFANAPIVYQKRGKSSWKYFKNFINDLKNINDISDKRLVNAYERYKYFKLLELLNKIFSHNNVKFFFYEEMVKDQKNFFNNLALFLGINNHLENIELQPVNVTRKKGDEIKRINKYLFRNLNRPLSFIKNLLPSYLKDKIKKKIANILLDIQYFFDPIKLNQDQKKIIFDYYKEDNQLLAKFYNKDLDSLGY